jgi:hypothetical protein
MNSCPFDLSDVTIGIARKKHSDAIELDTNKKTAIFLRHSFDGFSGESNPGWPHARDTIGIVQILCLAQFLRKHNMKNILFQTSGRACTEQEMLTDLLCHYGLAIPSSSKNYIELSERREVEAWKEFICKTIDVKSQKFGVYNIDRVTMAEIRFYRNKIINGFCNIPPNVDTIVTIVGSNDIHDYRSSIVGSYGDSIGFLSGFLIQSDRFEDMYDKGMCNDYIYYNYDSYVSNDVNWWVKDTVERIFKERKERINQAPSSTLDIKWTDGNPAWEQLYDSKRLIYDMRLQLNPSLLIDVASNCECSRDGDRQVESFKNIEKSSLKSFEYFKSLDQMRDIASFDRDEEWDKKYTQLKHEMIKADSPNPFYYRLSPITYDYQTR